MVDITFGRSGPYGGSDVAIPGRTLMSMNALFLLLLMMMMMKVINQSYSRVIMPLQIRMYQRSGPS